MARSLQSVRAEIGDQCWGKRGTERQPGLEGGGGGGPRGEGVAFYNLPSVPERLAGHDLGFSVVYFCVVCLFVDLNLG